MSEEAKHLPEEERAPLSTGKRNALLRYMAILFGVAFLLVLLSFLIQMRDSRETIADLHKSNASALENALQLQEENQMLAAANADLTDQVADLEAASEEASEAFSTRFADLEVLIKQAEAQQKASEDAAAQTLSDTQGAYDLLLRAQIASSTMDRESLRAALDALAPQVALLSPEAQEQYDVLVLSLTAERVPEADTQE